MVAILICQKWLSPSSEGQNHNFRSKMTKTAAVGLFSGEFVEFEILENRIWMKNSTQNRENQKNRGFFGQNFRSEILKPG